MTETENYLRAVEFRCPQWIPFNVPLMPGTWQKYREKLEELVMRHPIIFGSYEKGSRDFDALGGTYQEGEYTDEWGCVWKNVQPGLDALVVGHPLSDWSKFKDYEPPDPLAGRDWEAIAKEFSKAKKERIRAAGGFPHGFMYQRLYYLRGFENFMIDIATDSPELHEVIDMVFQYNMKQVEKFLEAGANMMHFGDDLGIQNRLPMSPEHFRKYLGPCFAKMFGACREAGAHVYLHTDGHIVEIMEDLIKYGVTILNPEDYPNGLDAIASKCKGKVCVDLTLAQQYFPFYTPEELFDYVEEVVVKLGAKEGGLILYVEIDPDVPLENIEAICQAIEKYRFYYSSQ